MERKIENHAQLASSNLFLSDYCFSERASELHSCVVIYPQEVISKTFEDLIEEKEATLCIVQSKTQ